MKSTLILTLATLAIAAPTGTVENRELPNLDASSATGGEDAWKALIPGLTGSASPDSANVEDTSSTNAISVPGLGSGSSTENGVVQNSGCKEFTYIFARGTTEPGNMGLIIGPPLATKLRSLTGDKVTVQGVTYPASIGGNAQMGGSGGPEMAQLVGQALKQCPQTKILLGGYSQGAMAVHNAAGRLGAGQVAAAVLFGDPLKAQPVGKVPGDKVKGFCHLGDPVCLNGGDVTAHITYGRDADAAAQFLLQAAR
ncbi:Cutinase [Penicillium cf. griseofulvum]|uniref:cutinase n=1 Tax=Penicillium cf. griseofulvum TaxID=2972120 RepID=A0A9W9MT35_9EURO|nr:Cutinase [Penicillium cf. griseofulvum]KAJ5446369.1 Cutinase [Penicillium cf. griseofulvum]KAJ5448111.1 Cutinase [Penicillium cf. griseofulvum]